MIFNEKQFATYTAKRFANLAYDKMTQARKEYENATEHKNDNINAALVYLGFALGYLNEMEDIKQ